jgi:hypothetical protein
MCSVGDDPRIRHLRQLAYAQGFWLRRDHSVDDGYWLVDHAVGGTDSAAAGAAIPLAEVARRLGAEAVSVARVLGCQQSSPSVVDELHEVFRWQQVADERP